jgi:hypothetical protein
MPPTYRFAWDTTEPLANTVAILSALLFAVASHGSFERVRGLIIMFAVRISVVIVAGTYWPRFTWN